MKKKVFKYVIAMLTAVALFVGCSNPVGTDDSVSVAPGSRTVYDDNVAPSQDPPGGLEPYQVPMMVSIGFDDNAYSGLPGTSGSGGMEWCLDLFKDMVNKGVGKPGTFDKAPARASFYMTSVYISMQGADSPVFVKRSWRRAYEEGHEIGNHSQAHQKNGRVFTLDRWNYEIQTCNDWLTKEYRFNPTTYEPDSSIGIGVPASEIIGLRAPFLLFNDNAMTAIKNIGYQYDCSMTEGFQGNQDGTNNFYPYTLDNGSPGNKYNVQENPSDDNGPKVVISNTPGLWEMPLYAVIVPPDDKCEEYGVPSGLRGRINSRVSWDFSGKITGLDYNMFWNYKMTKEEFVATMKYTLDLKLNGNRAPFLFGAHSDFYSSRNSPAPTATYEEMQQGLKEFVEYANSKEDVRLVSVKDVLKWMKKPEPLDKEPLQDFNITVTADETKGTVTPSGSFIAKEYSTVNITINPKTGFAIDGVLLDTNPVSLTGNSFEFKVENNHNVVVNYEAIPTYTVSTEVVGNGTISPENKVVNQGDDLLLTLSYDGNTQVDQLLIDGVDQKVDRLIKSFNLENISKNTLVKVVYGPYVKMVEAVYSVTSDWGTGFQAKIEITNKTDTAISSWTLTWKYEGNQQVQVYSTNTTQVGKSVTVTNKPWNGTIAAGATKTLGLGGTYSGTNDIPSITVHY